MAGTGRVADYIGPAPDLSYLGGRPEFIRADEPYDPSMDVDALMRPSGGQRGLPRDVAIRAQILRKAAYEKNRREKDSYDQDWALHFLTQADPSKENFNEGLNRMFQQFPGAAKSPEVARMVELKRGLAPKTDMPQELADAMVDYSALDRDDPDFNEKAAEISGRIKGTPAARHYKGIEFFEKVNRDQMMHKDRMAKRKDEEDAMIAYARRNKIPLEKIKNEAGKFDQNLLDDAIFEQQKEKESHDMGLKLAMAGLNPDKFRVTGDDGKPGLIDQDAALMAIASKHANQLPPEARKALIEAKIALAAPITDDEKISAWEAKNGRTFNPKSKVHWSEGYGLVKDARRANLEMLTQAILGDAELGGPDTLSTDQKPPANPAGIKSIKLISK